MESIILVLVPNINLELVDRVPNPRNGADSHSLLDLTGTSNDEEEVEVDCYLLLLDLTVSWGKFHLDKPSGGNLLHLLRVT